MNSIGRRPFIWSLVFWMTVLLLSNAWMFITINCIWLLAENCRSFDTCAES